MSRVQGLQTWPTPAHLPFGYDDADHPAYAHARARRLDRQGLPPVLIQVPLVTPARVRRLGGRAETRARVHGRSITYRPGKPRPRRRLRREIRLMGSILMMVAPLIVATVLLRNVSTTRDAADGGDVRPAPVSLSSDVRRPSFNREPLVIFPGYLLPEDRGEEASHAGG
jgi:hypothetical protein